MFWCSAQVEYEVWAPEGCTPGEMVAMDIYPESADIVAMSKDTLQASEAAIGHSTSCFCDS